MATCSSMMTSMYLLPFDHECMATAYYVLCPNSILTAQSSSLLVNHLTYHRHMAELSSKSSTTIFILCCRLSCHIYRLLWLAPKFAYILGFEWQALSALEPLLDNKIKSWVLDVWNQCTDHHLHVRAHQQYFVLYQQCCTSS